MVGITGGLIMNKYLLTYKNKIDQVNSKEFDCCSLLELRQAINSFLSSNCLYEDQIINIETINKKGGLNNDLII
jgi:hypothetical protein